jgi:iron complex outermembrane recepter protein
VLNGINSAASWNLGSANNPSPAGNPLGWIFGGQNINVKDKENFGQLDGEYAIDRGALAALRFGVRFSDHERSSAGVIGQGPACKDANGNTVPFDWSQQYWCPVGTQSPADPANFPQGFTNYPGNFGSGLGGSFPRDVWQYSPQQLAAYNFFTNRDPVSRRDWTSEYALDETSNAAYLQGDLGGNGWSGNVGLRLVRTELKVTNNVAATAQTPGAITSSAFGPFVAVTTENSYTDVLPSANLRIDLQKDLLARFAASRTMARPDYSALAGAVSLSPPPDLANGTGSGSGGNPNLKPVYSNNFDANLEWYFAPRSLLSAGAFYMDLSSYIGFGRETRTFKSFNQAYPDGIDVPYVLTVPVNSSGKVKGIELAYEQPLFTNFGVAANYTYADGEESGGGDLVGTSKHTYNLVAFFENAQFNARIAYNFRSKFYSGLDRQTAFYQDDTDSLSASIGWRFNDQLSISFDARNLNNPKLKYYALNEDQPRSIYQNGRQYYLTGRIKF